ncbi:hypothetical protein EDD22DRAFT_842536 [Suillus occidentalis]|nr:hypothetical protein EDD22DRAFT_842536 [Suillus occidentalis]
MCDSAIPHFHAVWTADDRYSARMGQAGTTNHTLDNVGGDETLQRNGLDTCPTSSMLKQMLVSFCAMARNEDSLQCYAVLISTPGVVFSDAPAGPSLRLGQAMKYFRSLMVVHGLWACSKDGISVKVALHGERLRKHDVDFTHQILAWFVSRSIECSSYVGSGMKTPAFNMHALMNTAQASCTRANILMEKSQTQCAGVSSENTRTMTRWQQGGPALLVNGHG